MCNPDTMKTSVHRIGREMVDCGRQCAGVANDKRMGILQAGAGSRLHWPHPLDGAGQVEDEVKKQLPPLQTFRTCTRHFLSRELQEIPADWPLIAVSWDVFRALAFLYPNRVVIGVPHPTGGFGNPFRRFFNADGELLPPFKLDWSEMWGEEGGKAVWLDPTGGRRR